MQKLDRETARIMAERFGKDTLIALATEEDGVPYVRHVNAYYEDRAFYVITHGLSNKMRQIAKNPIVAISGEWFTAHGEGADLGWFNKPENSAMAHRLRAAFSAWIDNGHNDFDDENTCLLRIQLKSGLLFSNGTRYEIDLTL